MKKLKLFSFILCALFVCTNTLAANTPATAGTYVVDNKKPGSDLRFFKLGNGVYIHRNGNSSWTSGLGMKMNGNTNGVVVYVDSSIKFSALIKKKEDKNAVNVSLKAYAITNGSSTMENFENGTENSTTVTVTYAETASYESTASFEALANKKAEEKNSSEVTLSAGYWYIVGTDDKGTTFLYSVKLTAAEQTVSYDANGGSGSIADATGTSITLSDGTGFTAPSGYTFAGWNTAADGSGTAYAAGQSVSVSLDLYAQWTQAITLDANTANHGTGDNGSATALYNGTELSNIVHTTPEAGYTLKGYYTAATEGVKVLNANGSFAANAITDYVVEGAWKKTGATTLYAQYAEPEKYTVTHTLTNVTATSGATGENAATQGTAYVAVFAANDEYSLPASVTVTIGGEAQTAGEGYTYSEGTVTILGAYVTGAIVITVEGVHNVCAAPTITASTAFNFTNKGYAVTITNNEAGSTLKYSTDGTNWSDYTAALYATTTTTFYAKSVKSNYADSEAASKEVTNSYDAEKKYVAWVYTSGYGSASYAFATDPMVIGLQADYNVVEVNLGADKNPTTATDIAEADLIVCSEAMTGNKTLSNNMKTYAGSTPMIGLKAFNYTKDRWSWGTPANPSSTTTSFKPKYSNYKVLNGVTFESDGSIKLATASSGNVIQTVQFGTTDCTAPEGNVIMGNLDDSDAKAVMYASTKYFGLGLSSDCWETYTDNAVTIVKNAAAMLIAGEDLDALMYSVNIAVGIVNGTVEADKATAKYGEEVTLTINPAEGYVLNVLTVKDAMDADVAVTNGKFTMPASNVTITATFKQEGGGTAITNTSAATKAQKRIENGQLVIEKNGQVFNAMGQTIR